VEVLLTSPADCAHAVAPDDHEALLLLLPLAGSPFARQRNVRICSSVQGASGEKVVGPVPFVMPCSTAHSTAL
jgi:hypothetical protein